MIIIIINDDDDHHHQHHQHQHHQFLVDLLFRQNQRKTTAFPSLIIVT